VKRNLSDGINKAMRATAAGQVADATATLLQVLGRRGPPQAVQSSGQQPPTRDGFIEKAGKPAEGDLAYFRSGLHDAASHARWALSGAHLKPRRSDPLCAFFQKEHGNGFAFEKSNALRPLSGKNSPSVPSGSEFLGREFKSRDGTRQYKLYVPSSYQGRPAPLIIMLHGCTQSADDFAVGTRMNMVAEEHGILVVYPEQTSAANMQKCWNWFSEADQNRDRGEPSLIAGITREVMRDYTVDPSRVYVAGLSAGGAAAAIMGQTYPDLYAAIGVHSGLARGAAHDMPSAFGAMRGDGAASRHVPADRQGETCSELVPTIVFHGDRDTTVNPRNADAVVSQAARGMALAAHTDEGVAPGGLGFSRTRYTDRTDQVLIEQWIIRGGGHAWSGGSSLGSYTEERGVDASTEMVHFFLEHSRSLSD
jgi:poly(hydroxyalkanoate) depolymerase family esterase